MPLRGILDSTSRLLKLVKRPTRDDFTTSIKITLIGVGLLGVIGFIVKFMGTILLAARPTA